MDDRNTIVSNDAPFGAGVVGQFVSVLLGLAARLAYDLIKRAIEKRADEPSSEKKD